LVNPFGVQLAVEHFDALLELFDAGEQSPSFCVERADTLPKGVHNGLL
jgi:hypothetical protein